MTEFRCRMCRRRAPTEEIFWRNNVAAVCSKQCLDDYYQQQIQDRRDRLERSPRSRRRTAHHLDYPTRKRVRNRDGQRCRWCGATANLEVHHIEYISQGGSDQEHNLITLCAPHHAQAHTNKGLYQPALKALIWLGYVNGRWHTVPEALRITDRLWAEYEAG